MSTTSSNPPHRVAEAVNRLKSFVTEKEDMSVEFSEPLSDMQLEELEKKYQLKLPPSYVHFLRTYGTFKVMYGGSELIGMELPDELHAVAPDPRDAAGGDNPDVAKAINEALFFQRITDDAVEDFWCFNPRDRSPEGELGVVPYYHDNTFQLPQLLGSKDARHFRDFSTHVVDVINDFIDSYSEE